MAKNKKSPAKAAKKAAKAKPAAKSKKSTQAKAKKPVAKKPVAKKAAPKKAAAKKPVVAKKAVKKAAPSKPVHVVQKPVAKTVAKPTPEPKKVQKAKQEQKVKQEKVVAPVSVSPAQVTSKPVPPQLNIFPVPNQRPIAHKPAKASSSKDERTRYSEDELKEFEALILRKLDKAREEYKILKDTLNRNNDEGTDATSGGNTKVLEDGAETAEKENLSQLAARQQKYITNLENALVRIKNGTYGICSVTGKLIPKERLIAVPHTTQSIEAKMMQQD
jgi:RNA polymerase-binding transcription factor DksA